MQSTIRSNSLGENQIINNQIYAHYYIPNDRTNLISERSNPQTIQNPPLQSPQGRGWRINLFIHEYDVFMRKNALKTAEMSD